MQGHERADVEQDAGYDLSRRSFRVLVTTQAIFFAALAWCIFLVHGDGVQDNGISYYGVHSRTIVFAIIGYLAGAIGLWRASTIFKEGGLDPLVWVGVRVVAVMLVLLLVTPYTGGAFLNWAHMTTGVIGALVQLAISWTLVRRVVSLGVATGFGVQLLGGVLGALSLPDWHFQILLTAEVLIELGFSWCLLEWTRVLVAPAGK
jgi:hypothetical protein